MLMVEAKVEVPLEPLAITAEAGGSEAADACAPLAVRRLRGCWGDIVCEWEKKGAAPRTGGTRCRREGPRRQIPAWVDGWKASDSRNRVPSSGTSYFQASRLPPNADCQPV